MVSVFYFILLFVIYYNNKQISSALSFSVGVLFHIFFLISIFNIKTFNHNFMFELFDLFN